MTIDLQALKLEQILVHRPPMILISRVAAYSEKSLRAEVDISEASMFYDLKRQGVPSWVGLEYMAQSIAAFAGIENYLQGEKIKIGFLLGSRKYISHEQIYATGSTVQVDVTPLYREEDGLGQFECKLYCNDVLANEANINIFCPPNPNEFLRGAKSE